MEVSSQLHAPATLALMKEPPHTNYVGDQVGPAASVDVCSNIFFPITCLLRLVYLIIWKKVVVYISYAVVARCRSHRIFFFGTCTI